MRTLNGLIASAWWLGVSALVPGSAWAQSQAPVPPGVQRVTDVAAATAGHDRPRAALPFIRRFLTSARRMRISIFGLGYVGAVTAGCLSNHGHSIVGVDVHPAKVADFNNGIPPIVAQRARRLVDLVARRPDFDARLWRGTGNP